MSSAPANTAPRKSFAQVAAAAHKPATSAAKPAASGSESNRSQTKKPSQETQVANPVIKNGVQHEKKSPVPQPRQTEGSNHLDESMKSLGFKEDTVQGPTVDNMAKKDNSDTKSVTSRTTMTFDEKESLRPDDSASMKAGPEEETSSPSESQAINSKPNTNLDARAFRDQLHEIDRAEASRKLVQHPTEESSHQSPAQANGAEVRQLYPAPQPLATPQPNYQVEQDRPRVPPQGFFLPPDEKLLEALAKPTDRLFVLKVEQDLIDFIKDSKENELRLPQTNAFYRLLAHKLAEYYFLGHLVDEAALSIRIFRLPASRLPPPLLDSVPKSHNTTPPPQAPARKIMRRGDGANQPKLGEFQTQQSNQNPHADSNVTSAAGSCVETDEAQGRENTAKDKAHLSREEREDRYWSTRARIWQEHDEKAPDTSGGNSNQNDDSRESSVSGAKKGRRGRRPKDDSFEARSAYCQYNGHPYVANTFSQNPSQGMYVNNNTSFGQFEAMGQPLQPSSQQMTTPGSPMPQHQNFVGGGMTWPEPQYAQGFGMQQNVMAGNHFAPGSYEVSNGFQYHQQNLASQSTPKPHAPGLATGNFQNFQPHVNQSWSQPNYPGQYMNPGAPAYTSVDFSMSPNTQYMHPQPFGATHSMYPHIDPHLQSIPSPHSLQFNPRSQSFVPRSQNGNSNSMNGNFVTPNYAWQQATPPSQRLHSHSSPESQVSPSRKPLQHWNHQQQRAGNPQTGNNNPSSISKWSTSSMLPAKPPPLASSLNFGVPKYSEGQQPLPSHPHANNDNVSANFHDGGGRNAKGDAANDSSKPNGRS